MITKRLAVLSLALLLAGCSASRPTIQKSAMGGDEVVEAEGMAPYDAADVAGSKAAALAAAQRSAVELVVGVYVTGKDEHAVLAECERGEDVAVKSYEKALASSDLPGTLLPMIQKQFAQVKQTHDRVRDLRDSLVAH